MIQQFRVGVLEMQWLLQRTSDMNKIHVSGALEQRGTEMQTPGSHRRRLLFSISIRKHPEGSDSKIIHERIPWPKQNKNINSINWSVRPPHIAAQTIYVPLSFGLFLLWVLPFSWIASYHKIHLPLKDKLPPEERGKTNSLWYSYISVSFSVKSH